MVRRSVGVSSFIMIPLLVFVAIAAKPLVGLVLSEKWLPCAIFLSIFCILRIPGIITSIDKQVFYALGKSQIGLYYEIGLLVANLISLFVMIPYGPLAIAIGFTVIEYIGNFVLCIIASKVYGYTIIDRTKDIILSLSNTAILFIACWSITYLNLSYFITLILQSVVGIILYVLLAYFTKDKNLVIIKEIINNTFHKKIL